MTPKLKFGEGEKVLCFHGPLIYEAKCLKSSVSKEKHIKYLIHYAGWNKNWDEWVPESRVLKYNDTNVQRQKEVQKAHSSLPAKTKKAAGRAKKSESGSTTPASKQTIEPPSATKDKEKEKEKDKDKEKEKEKDKDKEKEKDKDKDKEKEKESESRASSPQAETVSQDSGSDQPRKKRGRLDLSIESEEQFLNKVEVKIKIPEELQSWLVDDWDIITRQQKLVNLPTKLNVNDLLDNYYTHKKTSKAHNQQKDSVLLDIIHGIREYFNATLGSQLLYKFERPQYSEVLTNYPDFAMSKIYGPIHLLRLFVKMGSMLGYTSLDEKAMPHVLSHIRDLLKYMATNKSGFFNVLDYGNATPEYHRKVQ